MSIFIDDLTGFLRSVLALATEPMSGATLAAKATSWARDGVAAGVYPASVLKPSGSYQNPEQVIHVGTVNRILGACDDIIDAGVRDTGGYNSRRSRHWITAAAHLAAQTAAADAEARAAVSRERVTVTTTDTGTVVAVDGVTFATVQFGTVASVAGPVTDVFTADTTARVVSELARLARRAIAR